MTAEASVAPRQIPIISGNDSDSGRVSGLSVNNPADWQRLHNPVLGVMAQRFARETPESNENTTAIVDVPPPEYLSLKLGYRRHALQACVAAGDTVDRGDSLTHKQLQPDGRHILPAVLSPNDALVESISHTTDGERQQVNLKVLVNEVHQKGVQANFIQTWRISDQSKTPAASSDLQPRVAWHCEDWSALTRLERWRCIRASAIRGHGGAGFLLADKADPDIQTIIVNAVECEPLINCDAALIHHHAIETLQGVLTLIQMAACTRCVIAIESGREWQIERLQEALADLCRQAPDTKSLEFLQQLSEVLEFYVAPAVYPQGAETVLYTSVTGKKLPEGERPSEHGVCCTNIATCHALDHLARTGWPAATRIVTLTGDAMFDSSWGGPVNVRAGFGTSISHILAAGGLDSATLANSPIRVQAGGPLCGKETDLATLTVHAAMNCVVLSHTPAQHQTDNCIRCGNCASVCPASLLPQQLHLAVTNNDRELAMQHKLDACIECGCCDLVCPSKIPLTQEFRQARIQSAEYRSEKKVAEASLERYERRLLRLEQKEKLRNEQRQQRKKNTGNKTAKRQAIAEALKRSQGKLKPK